MKTNACVLRVGTTLGRRPGRPFGIMSADRCFHMLALGQTGAGKSTLLWNLMRQDAQRDQGFCLVDPHGDLAEAVRAVAGDECLYWNAADRACQYGYNPLAYVEAEYRPLVASGFIDVLKKQWADAWGARMEHLLRMALLTLLNRSGSTIADIMQLFLDDDFRRDVVNGLPEGTVRAFWEKEYGALRYKTAMDGVAPIANKLGAFLAHPVVSKAICEPVQPLRFRHIMDEGKVLVVNLAKGRLGADISNVLGGLVVSSIANAAYSRQNVPERERRQWFLYLDEFQAFTTSAFAEMLPELRKYGLLLVLSTQSATRVSDDVREAMFGNVGTIIAFRVGATDAALLAKQFGADVPEPRDLVNLRNYEMFIKLMIDGMPSKPFSARSLAPSESD